MSSTSTTCSTTNWILDAHTSTTLPWPISTSYSRQAAKDQKSQQPPDHKHTGYLNRRESQRPADLETCGWCCRRRQARWRRPRHATAAGEEPQQPATTADGWLPEIRYRRTGLQGPQQIAACRAAKDSKIDGNGIEPAGSTRSDTILEFLGWICGGLRIGDEEEQGLWRTLNGEIFRSDTLSILLWSYLFGIATLQFSPYGTYILQIYTNNRGESDHTFAEQWGQRPFLAMKLMIGLYSWVHPSELPFQDKPS